MQHHGWSPINFSGLRSRRASTRSSSFLRNLYFCGAIGWLWLHIQDHTTLSIDQVIRRVNKEGRTSGAAVQRACGSVNETDFGITPVAASRSNADRYLVPDASPDRIMPVDLFATGHAALTTGIRFDRAGVYRETFTDQSLGHAARNDIFKHNTEGFAVTKPAMTILGESQMVRDFTFQPKLAEPAIGEIQMHFFA